jgi:hypothetical protein
VSDETPTYIVHCTDGKSSTFHTPAVEAFIYSLDRSRRDPEAPLPHAYFDDDNGVEWCVHFNPDNVCAVSTAVRPNGVVPRT